jgi:hypothetical protein
MKARRPLVLTSCEMLRAPGPGHARCCQRWWWSMLRLHAAAAAAAAAISFPLATREAAGAQADWERVGAGL